eukprot:TRINITY_DN23463_c0_g1_i2.p1 TRINITY_DN23463_c0_g1~~TRINITY_DN23463_c0_g1_i2.p1  ORF type:complete len:149 (-),score=31.51 TRINITY_DN23463_c0_g1_i2:52-498(-)
MCIRDRYQRRVHGDILKEIENLKNDKLLVCHMLTACKLGREINTIRTLMGGDSQYGQALHSKIFLCLLENCYNGITEKMVKSLIAYTYENIHCDSTEIEDLFNFIPDSYQGLTEQSQLSPSPCTLRCCLLYTSPSPRDLSTSRMPSSA